MWTRGAWLVLGLFALGILGAATPALADEIPESAKGWVLLRRTPDSRNHIWVDGIIVVPGGQTARLQAIRRGDGDHRVMLLSSGSSGKPPEALKTWVLEARHAHLVPHQVASRNGRVKAVAYVPAAAQLRILPQADRVLLELELPWEHLRLPVDRVEGDRTRTP